MTVLLSLRRRPGGRPARRFRFTARRFDVAAAHDRREHPAPARRLDADGRCRLDARLPSTSRHRPPARRSPGWLRAGCWCANRATASPATRCGREAVPMLERGDARIFQPTASADDRMVPRLVLDPRTAPRPPPPAAATARLDRMRHRQRRSVDRAGTGRRRRTRHPRRPPAHRRSDGVHRRAAGRGPSTRRARRPLVGPRAGADAPPAIPRPVTRRPACGAESRGAVGGPRRRFATWVGALDEWRVIPYLDPGLPETALPAGWPGRASRELFAVIRERYADAALAFARRVTAVWTTGTHPRDPPVESTHPHPAAERRVPVPTIVVEVMPKAELLDPQGKAVAGALARIGKRPVHRCPPRQAVRADGRRRRSTTRRARPSKRSRTTSSRNSVIEDVVGIHYRGGRRLMRIGVVTFPGSLDDRDALRAIRLAGAEPVALWHGDHDLAGRRRARAARRLQLRRLPALRRDRQPLADHDRGHRRRRQGPARARHLQRLPDARRGAPRARAG